jgi:hypothetical protein
MNTRAGETCPRAQKYLNEQATGFEPTHTDRIIDIDLSGICYPCGTILLVIKEADNSKGRVRENRQISTVARSQ